MTSIQTLEQFQSTFSSDPVEVEFVEQFGKDAVFYLKPLTSTDRDSFEASVVGDGKTRNLLNLRAKLVALCLCDKKGTPLGPAKEVGKLRADLIGALFDKIRDINGMDKDDVEEAGKD